jgi:uncharacterized phage protein (TIGR02218 family)
MSAGAAALYDHLATGCTTVCHLWRVERRDGQSFGFTDHDLDLSVDGQVYRADTGLTARALQQTTGLSVDNTEAVGALSSVSVSEADLAAGRFDRAAVSAWMVNWADLTQRVCLFRGTFGEVSRVDGTFRAELRGLTEPLNQPQGRTFQRLCSAILGDQKCRFALETPGYSSEIVVTADTDRSFSFDGQGGFADRWFERGRLIVLSGDATGLFGVIKVDRLDADSRIIELWETLPITVKAGDRVRIEAGCDRMPGTCRRKFNNLPNFRGFPHIPGEDWITAYPVSGSRNTGGSLFGADGQP